ncbi:MAG TPA: tetratricopeptide repeat protein [Pyrinomonadaceae bacterium]|nr:tetratricopeptide repeat protein [Pyrinomonadaceae bacterium]
MMTVKKQKEATGAAGGQRRRVPHELAARVARGEITLADLAGMSRKHLYDIAEVGFRLMNGGQVEQARAIYRGLVAAAPQDSVFHCHLGAAHLRLGDAESAIKEFDAALRLNRANVDALAGRGEARLSRREFADGITDLSAAIDLDREAKRPSTLRARALLLALTQAAKKKSE